MTRKLYKSAMGKTVDLGALLLQNENVRAVGNMNVNARGDVLDGANRVIDQKNRQVQRRYQRTTNVSADTPVHSSNLTAHRANEETTEVDTFEDEVFSDISSSIDPVVAPAPVEEPSAPVGGLAAAIARSRTIKQEKEKTLRERAQEQKLKKI